ncbi:MAG: DUF4160 domain-containing protein [Thermoleophilaceae bacterium]
MNDDRIDALVESRMRGNVHVRFGGRRRGNHRPKGRHGASPSTLLTMYWRDHPPPHFHATYAGHVAQIAIESLEPLDGWLPPRALRLVKEWAGTHRDELRENWDRARVHEALEPIDPLP